MNLGNLCDQGKRLAAKHLELKRSNSLLKKRRRLEEERFNIGKIELFQVIQAANDEYRSSFELQRVQSELAQNHWQLSQVNGSLLSYIKGLERHLK